ncbi:MAG: hypothetical protein NXI04_15710 [Planctomycetaceae bacterium]|nr:hypothetical protein [Planctomycetaceae bacterium]
MNAAQFLLVLVLLFLSGCDRAASSRQDSRKQQTHLRATPAVTLDQLQGVHPASPLLLKTNVFAFQPTSKGDGLICSDRDGVSVWDLADGKRRLLLESPGIVIDLAEPRSGHQLLTVAAGRTTSARLWDRKSGRLVREFASPFAADAQSPTLPDDAWNQWRDPSIWRFASTGFVPRDGFGLTCAAFNADGSRIAAGCEDGRVVIWETATAKPLTTLETELSRVLSVRFSADGSRLLVAARDDRIQLWNLETSQLVRQFEETRTENWVSGYRPAICFSDDGTRFALYSPRQLAIVVGDADSGKTLHCIADNSRLPGGKLQLSLQRGLAFIDDTSLFSNTGGWIRIWNIPSGQVIAQQECQSGVNAGYAYPNIHFVQYLPSLDAFIAVEVENDENTGHDDWTTVSLRPRILFENMQVRP